MKQKKIFQATLVVLVASLCLSAQSVMAAVSHKSARSISSETAMAKCSKDSEQRPAYTENMEAQNSDQCGGCGKCRQSCSPQKKPCPKPCPKTCSEPCQKCKQCPAKPKCNQCAQNSSPAKECAKCSSCGIPLNT